MSKKSLKSLPIQLHPDMFMALRMQAACEGKRMSVLVRELLAARLNMADRPEVIYFREGQRNKESE